MLASPRLLPLHLLAATATAAAVLLGFWQLEAWQADRAAAARDLTSAVPRPLDDVLDPDAAFPSEALGRPVHLRGSWVPDGGFLVSDRRLDGRDGYWMVTPIAVCDDDGPCAQEPALLVVRGWTADPDTAPPPPDGPAELTGWLQPPEGGGRPDQDPSDDVLPELRIADAIQRVDQDLYGAYLVLQDANPSAGSEGLEPVTPDSLPEPGSSTGLRNLFYAVEWWVFAAFAAFVWSRWCKDELARGRWGAATPDDDRA